VTLPHGSGHIAQAVWRALLVLGVLGGCYWPCSLSAPARAASPPVTVWAWGLNRYGQLGDGTTTDRTTPVPVDGATGLTALAAGCFHSLALATDGTVWT
jgi:Regulator of chromosome condensation (RCC1) repeat